MQCALMVYFKPVTGYLGLFHIKLPYEVVKKAAYFLKTYKTAGYAITHVQKHPQSTVMADIYTIQI